MPWMETQPMIEREKFVVELVSGRWSMSELCRRHGVSRRTGYKWRDRFEAEGIRGLTDRSRAPKFHVSPRSKLHIRASNDWDLDLDLG